MKPDVNVVKPNFTAMKPDVSVETLYYCHDIFLMTLRSYYRENKLLWATLHLSYVCIYIKNT